MARTIVPVTNITPPKAALTTALTGTNNDLTFTAVNAGPAANQTQVAYINAGANQTLAVTVFGWLISVNLATDGSSVITSTASLVLAALQTSADVARLVTVTLASANDGSGLVTALSATNLAGGSLQTTPPSQVNSDTTNKHYFTGNNGDIYIEVFNNNASPQTVSVLYSPSYAPIATVAAQSETIPNAATRYLGPFAKSAFDQNGNGDVYFDPSVATDLKFRVLNPTL